VGEIRPDEWPAGTGIEGRPGKLVRMAAFEIRFDGGQIGELASRYSYAGENRVINELSPRVRAQGHLTLGDLREICAWKSSRIGRRVERNRNEEVVELTGMAFRGETERARIGPLRLLEGVGWPTASVILHFCHEDRYPILDRRALWSLQVVVPSSFTFEFWTGYVGACRLLSDQFGVSMRDLDRALWQHSKETQPSL